MKRPELRMIRDALESVLSPALVDSTLEAAIRAAGREPQTPGDLVALVNGPLRAALAGRHGAAADDVIDDLLRALVPAEEARRGSSEITRELPLESAQVLVLVLSSSDTLGLELEHALGTNIVATLTYDEPVRAEKAIAFRPPAIVIIDGATFPLIEPSAMPALLSQLPTTTVRAVWGTDTPYGGAVLAELAARRAVFTPLDRREGIAPILDLIRARRYAS